MTQVYVVRKDNAGCDDQGKPQEHPNDWRYFLRPELALELAKKCKADCVVRIQFYDKAINNIPAAIAYDP